MTLKRWAISDCPYKSLVDGASNFWTASGSGTDEFYYNQTISQIEPNAVLINGVVTAKAANALGSLAAGEWSWGDNDTLGTKTIYVRLSDGADPDSKSADHIQCSEPQELIVAAGGKETIFLSLLLANFSTTDDANIRIYHTDGTDILFQWVIDILVTDSPFALDSKIILEPSDKFLIMSDIEKVSVLASGDES
jgi:hypothetical protein